MEVDSMMEIWKITEIIDQKIQVARDFITPRNI